MKLKDSEKSLLLGILGVIIAVVGIVYVAKPNIEAKQGIDAEIVQLQERLDRLNALQANREQYIADTERFNAEFEKILASFPADLNQEISVMFVEGIKDSNDFDVSSLGLGRPEQFYTLGLGGGDASLDTAAPAEGETTEAPAEGALTEGAAAPSAEYQCYRAAFPISYTGSYQALKDVVSYVNNYSERMTVNTLDITYNADADLYTGNLNMYCYAIQGPDRDERKINLDNVPIGVDNIFDGEPTAADAEISSLNKYDENEGAAIESSYDFYAMLNPASSDVSAKVVGQNGAGKEASVISNSDNTVSTLAFEFYEKDGKNYCKYTLDNSASYEAEVTSAEDIKLLLQSSARKDDGDKAGVRVTIRNTTSLPLYVKVSGDDAVTPRVNIASKSGSVKVYN